MPEVQRHSVVEVIDNVLALQWCSDYRSYYEALSPVITGIKARFGTALDIPVLDPASAKDLEDRIRFTVKAQGFSNPGSRWRWRIDDKVLNEVMTTISEAQA